MNAPQFTNRLAKEKSPYLIQHQHNPVDWYPWGEEAFEKARKEKKPIFLSIGYSTCHWCHVMAHESFESEEVAKILNEHFVSIKLDREERPDVDRVYMTFVQATTGGGGWPMTVFLTPDLKPFLGGTYYPPEDRYGRPGFKTLLNRIIDGWNNDREGIVSHGNTVAEQLREMAAATKPGGAKVTEALIINGLNPFIRSYDEEQGGFGSAPKFPRPSAINLLLRVYDRAPAERDGKAALGMALGTLKKMADGGMYDHLGGGFHRYSVDRFWHVPHYEKMLYDQAQLATAYIDAWQITKDAQWEKTARGILDYVLRDLTSKDGGFYSAEDADSIIEHGKPEHAEGAFYVWTKAEIAKVLGEDDAAIFGRVYGIEEDGNSPEGSDPHGELKGKNTLIAQLDVPAAAKLFKKSEDEIAKSLEASRKKLFDVRAKRPRPHLDDKVLTAWNGLMIGAFARAAQAFDDAAYLAAAQKAAGFLKQNLWKDGALRRSYREGTSDIPGFAEDYAYLIAGLLDLYEADFDTAWIDWALALQEKQDELFYDTEHWAYFSTTGKDANVLLRMKEDYDGAEPSPSSIAVLNLVRLSQIANDDKLRKRADETVAAFAEQCATGPMGVPQMLCGVDAILRKPRQIVIAGKADGADTRALLKEVRTRYLPHKIVLLADGSKGQEALGKRLEFIRTVAPIGGKAAAYVCEDFVCQLPVNDPAKLAELLRR